MKAHTSQGESAPLDQKVAPGSALKQTSYLMLLQVIDEQECCSVSNNLSRRSATRFCE